jgi:hypothetical protein
MYALHVHQEKVGPIPSVDGLLIQQLKKSTVDGLLIQLLNHGSFFNPCCCTSLPQELFLKEFW